MQFDLSPAVNEYRATVRRIIADYTRGTFIETQEFFPSMGREFVVQRFRTDR